MRHSTSTPTCSTLDRLSRPTNSSTASSDLQRRANCAWRAVSTRCSSGNEPGTRQRRNCRPPRRARASRRRRNVLAASAKLTALPLVEDALRAGALSGCQAVVVTDAAAMAPREQSRLVKEAKRASLAELKHACFAHESERRIRIAKRLESASTASGTYERSPMPKVRGPCMRAALLTPAPVSKRGSSRSSMRSSVPRR